MSGLLPRRLLQDLCAGASGDSGSPGTRWSAVKGSPIIAPLPHRWQTVAVSLMSRAMRLYSGDLYRVRPAFLCRSFSAANVSLAVAWRRQYRPPVVSVPQSRQGLGNLPTSEPLFDNRRAYVLRVRHIH